MVKKLRAVFMKKNYKRLIRKSSGLKRWLKEKEINCIWNGKVMLILLIPGLIKKTYYKNELRSNLFWSWRGNS